MSDRDREMAGGGERMSGDSAGDAESGYGEVGKIRQGRNSGVWMEGSCWERWWVELWEERMAGGDGGAAIWRRRRPEATAVAGRLHAGIW